MRKLYCVIVTYNGMKWIERCISSLLTSTYPVHIIVFDNCSTDATCSFIQKNYPQVQLIRSNKNLGFGQANNAAIATALDGAADAVFLLNQDASVTPETLAQLMLSQTGSPEFGIISPVHFNGAATGIDINFLQYFRKSELDNWISSALLQTREQYSLVNTEFVNAAAWLLSAGCLRKVGGFDPFFFHYGEDINYCQRTLYHGFKIGILPVAVIYHDREDRFIRPPSAAAVLKREWINLANYFSDIRHEDFLKLVFRRQLRYLVNLLIACLTFRFSAARFNAAMMGKTLWAIPAIRQSRKFARCSNWYK
ncbi:MAG: glycosyltransferase family 2 protein [Chitinophagaceae bacterium]|nr:glycosyltransferase family 2 protein [Chitinophagaceae bacterium]